MKHGMKVREFVEKVAPMYGFKACDGFGLVGFQIVDETRTVNIMLHENADCDYEKRTAVIRVTASASIATMGGNPTTADLFAAAETIKKAAALVEFLNERDGDMTFTETW